MYSLLALTHYKMVNQLRIIADNGDLPENIDPHTVYFAITNAGDSDLICN